MTTAGAKRGPPRLVRDDLLRFGGVSDKFLENAIEVEADAIADGEDAFVPSIMEHIELAGVHSGDSACVLPPYAVTAQQLMTLMGYTRRLALALHVVGLVNVQYAMKDGVIYKNTTD